MIGRIKAAVSAFRAAGTPTSEEGHSYSWYRSSIDGWAEEHYDDLVARKGVGVYREMVKRDDAIHAAVRLPIFSRLSKLPTFQPRSDAPEDRLAAWLCTEAFDRLDGGSMTRFLSDVLTGTSMGFSCTEKVWGDPVSIEIPDEVLRDNYEEDEGEEGAMPQTRESVTRRMVQFPRRYHLLPHETLTFQLDEYGNFKPDGVWQLSQRYVTPTTSGSPGMYKRMDRENFVLWKWLEEEGWGNPFGLSPLRPAYRWYFLKDQIIRWAGEYLERFGKPGLKVRTKESLGPAQIRSIDALLQQWQSSNRYRYGDGVESIEIMELSHTTTDAYEQWLKLCNRAIARCGLIPSLVMEGGESVGSNALGQSHRDTFDIVIDHLGELLADEVLREQVCTPIVRANLGEQVRPPLVIFPPMAEKDRTRTISEVKLAQEAGYIIPRQWAYEEAGIPIPGEGEDILDAPEPPQQQMPGMPMVGLGERDAYEMQDPMVRDLVKDVADANGGKDKDEVMAVLQGMGKRSRYAHRNGWDR